MSRNDNRKMEKKVFIILQKNINLMERKILLLEIMNVILLIFKKIFYILINFLQNFFLLESI